MSAEAASLQADSGRTAWARNLATPIRGFLHDETGGAVVLVLAALAALAWANIDQSSYESTWNTELAIVVGSHAFGGDLRDWVNEGLMTLFFLVVGLEAKRELDLGELRERRRLAIPVVAAVGGMAAAAGTYLLINAGGAGASGWGVAVSTDTALALGALVLITRGRWIRLRVFLLSLVVVDDFLALLVIALGYSEKIEFLALGIAVALYVVLIALRWAGSWRGPVVIAIAFGFWLAVFESGVDAVIAGLLVGLATSAYRPSREELERSVELTRTFREQPTPERAYSARAGLRDAISPNERLQFRLHPWTSRVIVPVFALANAGFVINSELLSRAVTSPITLGIVCAYVVGKPLGIVAASWLATRPALGGARPIVTWPALVGCAASAGIGFTVSLLVASIAFRGELLDEAKIGILATALISPAIAAIAFRVMRHLPAEVRARQLERTAGAIVDLEDDVDPDEDHIRGPIDAPVTLIEYGDYECPHCIRAAPIVAELLASMPEELRFVWRHLPLNDVHPHAQLAAEAAEAAGAQGRFWEMHDRLLAQDGALNSKELLGIASDLGLDLDRFVDDLRHHRDATRVMQDVSSADAAGVSGTPTFFINGQLHQGVYDVETMRREIRAAARTSSVSR